MSGSTERDPLLPSYEDSQNNPSGVIYTIRGPPPPPPPPAASVDGETAIPPNEPQTWIRRRWVRRKPTFCGKVGKIVLAVLAIIILAQPLIFFWGGARNTVRKTPPETLQPLPGCPALQYTRDRSFSFDNPRDFTLREHSTRSTSHGTKQIGGRVIVTPGPAEQRAKIVAFVSWGSSDYETTNSIDLHGSDSSLTIDTSSAYVSPGSGYSYSCLSMDVYLSVAPESELEAFHLYLEHLGVDFAKGLSLTVDRRTEVTTLSRSVVSHESKAFNSRETIVNVASGSITGNWALLDLLSLTAQSGSVNVLVEPGEASHSTPLPASLVVHSQSGSCHVTCRTGSNTPNRDYRTEVISQSGSVSGTFIHGSRTYLKSSSGSITAEITPYDGQAEGTSLVTEAHSGRTSLIVHEPYRHDVTFPRMQSKHTSISGSLELHYPRQWEGTIEGNVISGSITVRGRDAKIIEERRIGSSRWIKAERGDGNSYMSFDTASGSAFVNLN